jgi:hypothetical protein
MKLQAVTKKASALHVWSDAPHIHVQNCSSNPTGHSCVQYEVVARLHHAPVYTDHGSMLRTDEATAVLQQRMEQVCHANPCLCHATGCYV